MTATKTVTKEEKHSALVEYLQALGDIDTRYPKTVLKSLSKLASLKIRNKGRQNAYKKAGDKAVDNLKNGEFKSYGEIGIHMEAFRREFRIEVETCEMLFTSIKEFMNLEIMMHTETGKHALYDAQNQTYKVMKAHLKLAPAYYALNKTVNAEQNGKPNATKATKKAMEQYLRFAAEQDEAVQDRIGDLDGVETNCKKALSFEAIKVYVKNHPDEAHQSLVNGLRVVKQGVAGYNRATGVVGDTVGFGSGGAGKAVEVTTSVINVGTSFLSNTLISISINRQAKTKMKQEGALLQVVKFLNSDRAAVARDLADRFVDDLQANLDMLDPVVDAGNMLAGFALDSVGAGAATKVTGLVWPVLKIGLVKAARGYQDARLKLLTDALGEVPAGDDKSRLKASVSKANAMWQDWYKNSIDEIKETVENELASLGAQKLAEIAIGELIAIFVMEMLGKLQLRSAQEFSGDTLVSHLTKMTGSRENARRKVEAADRAAAARVATPA